MEAADSKTVSCKGETASNDDKDLRELRAGFYC
jgi:hypothetical protein